MKKKACIVTIADLGTLRNLKTDQTIAIIDAIAKTGFTVDIYCRDFANYSKHAIRKILPFGRLIPRLFVLLGKLIPSIPGNILYPYLLDVVAKRRIKYHQYDFVVCVDTRFARTLAMAKLKGLPTVSYEGINHPLFGKEVYRNLSETRYKFNLNRHLKAVRNTDHMIVLSKFVKETFLKYSDIPESNLYSTPLGVHTERFYPTERKPDMFRVIAIGNYDYRKGFQYLLRAWKELKLDDAELIFIGTPLRQMKGLIQKASRDLKGFKSIKFTKDILKYYQNASVFVFPSLLEGSAKVIYEAMACGVPVVCTEESGSVIEDGKDGYIISSSDVDQIKEKILFCYNNREAILKIGQNAREKVLSHYQWHHFSTRLEKVFTQITNQL